MRGGEGLFYIRDSLRATINDDSIVYDTLLLLESLRSKNAADPIKAEEVNQHVHMFSFPTKKNQMNTFRTEVENFGGLIMERPHG